MCRGHCGRHAGREGDPLVSTPGCGESRPGSESTGCFVLRRGATLPQRWGQPSGGRDVQKCAALFYQGQRQCAGEEGTAPEERAEEHEGRWATASLALGLGRRTES